MLIGIVLYRIGQSQNDPPAAAKVTTAGIHFVNPFDIFHGRSPKRLQAPPRMRIAHVILLTIVLVKLSNCACASPDPRAYWALNNVPSPSSIKARRFAT